MPPRIQSPPIARARLVKFDDSERGNRNSPAASGHIRISGIHCGRPRRTGFFEPACLSPPDLPVALLLSFQAIESRFRDVITYTLQQPLTAATLLG